MWPTLHTFTSYVCALYTQLLNQAFCCSKSAQENISLTLYTCKLGEVMPVCVTKMYVVQGWLKENRTEMGIDSKLAVSN